MRALIFMTSALIGVLAITACSPIIRVYSEEEPGVHLRKYRTYAWLDNVRVEKDDIPFPLRPETENAIRQAVDGQMERLGFKRCGEEPDLMLHYHVMIKDQEVYFQDWWCDDEEWHKYGRCHRIRQTNYREGTLIIDLIDTQSGNQVWRGAAVGVLEQVPPVDIPARIGRAVTAIFQRFPG